MLHGINRAAVNMQSSHLSVQHTPQHTQNCPACTQAHTTLVRRSRSRQIKWISLLSLSVWCARHTIPYGLKHVKSHTQTRQRLACITYPLPLQRGCTASYCSRYRIKMCSSSTNGHEYPTIYKIVDRECLQQAWQNRSYCNWQVTVALTAVTGKWATACAHIQQQLQLTSSTAA